MEGIIDKMTKIFPLNSRFTLPFVFVLIVSLLFMLPVGFLQAQTSDDKIEYAENGTGPVAVFTATDPENAGDITWSLLTIDTNDDNVSDDDKDDFTMDGGVLSFKKSPNFEVPTGGGPDGTSATYTVTVVATDADFRATSEGSHDRSDQRGRGWDGKPHIYDECNDRRWLRPTTIDCDGADTASWSTNYQADAQLIPTRESATTTGSGPGPAAGTAPTAT